MKQSTVRIQSKFLEIRHSPDPVQSKSSPMLISVEQIGDFSILLQSKIFIE